MTRRQEDARLVASATSGGEWIEWDGGQRPVSPTTVVEVRFREHERVKDDFTSLIGEARDWTWRHDVMDDDIIAYRVVGAA